MSEIHKVVFYPVGNGDSSQIILSSGKRVLFDYCHRATKGEDDDEPIIDLAKQLREELKNVKRDYFDVVAFTHADVDHINGSTEFFELQHASKYQDDDRIKINELWVPAAMLLEDATNDQQSDEFVILRQEARHRLLEGKDIRVFSKPKALMDWLAPKLKERGISETARDHLFVDAGTLVPGFTIDTENVEFFCHSPFIKHCDEGDVVRNEAALIFNVRFLADGETYDYLAIGDSECEVLEDVVDITEYHNNMDRLEWNLYNVPHHCSYLALSDDKGDKETEPKPKIKKLLLQGKKDAYMVSSSKPIPNQAASYEQTQPPHIQARNAYERYLREVNGRKLLVTMEEPNAANPKPLEFEIGRYGITWKQAGTTGAAAIISSKPHRAG